MIPDHQSNIVFISDLLPQRYPAVTDAMKAVLGRNLQVIPGTKDIWCRDFMPIQLAPDRFVQFRYDPDYLKDDPHLRTEDGACLLNLKNCIHSDLVLDGGNVVRWSGTAILTEKACRENPGMSQPDLQRELKRLLEAERLVMIPNEPLDNIGHADGMVRLVDGHIVLVNDYRRANPGFGRRLAKALDGFKIILFPYCPTDQPGPDPDIWPATGVYINFLQTCDTIFVPAFGLAADDEAAAKLGHLFPKCRVVPVQCNDLALEGGVLNCVTWNAKTPAR